MKVQIIILFGLILNSVIVYSQETPAPIQSKSILIMDATVHVGNGEVIKRGAVGFKNGEINLVKNSLTNTIDTSEYDTVYHLRNRHLFPGFIAPNTTLGLQEIGAVRATRDQNETGGYNPHVRAMIAYNTDSEITPTVRTNGVLIAEIAPRGGIVSGTSGVAKLDAWNWEDAAISMGNGIHMNWPQQFQQTGWWAEPGEIKKSDKYSQTVREIKNFFQAAKAYNSKKQEIKNLRFDALNNVFNGQYKLYIHANFVKQINDVLLFKKELDIPHIVIVGGADSWMVAPRLKENNISVVLKRVHSLPQRPDTRVDEFYALPAKLAKEGVSFCFQNAGDMEQMGTRNLPFYAGTAVAHGLNYEEAITALTLNSAKILGIEKQYGSIEKGKSATFFISEGDPLDMKTNKLIVAFIDGRKISLENHQERNYKKYKQKYGL